MTCAYAFDAANPVQSHGAGKVFIPAWPLTNEAEFGPAPIASPKPLRNEMRRKAWLCAVIPMLPPQSHQRLALEAELRAIIKAIFSEGKG